MPSLASMMLLPSIVHWAVLVAPERRR